MIICGGDGDDSGRSSMDDCWWISFEGMWEDEDSVECDEEKRKSVIEPTLDDTHETVFGDVRPFWWGNKPGVCCSVAVM